MTRAQQAKLLLINGRFRYGCKRLPPLETPDWLPVVLALRELIESADRLCNKIGEIEGYESTIRAGVRQGCGVYRDARDLRDMHGVSDGVRWS
jgi:hypothetical protein